jgi:hypothetical protein
MIPEELHLLFAYDPATGALTNRITRPPRAIAGEVAGTVDGQGYVCVSVKRKKYKAHRIIWAMVMGYWPKEEIDHWDRNPSHNWWTNLREAGRGPNARNTRKREGMSSSYKGVSWDSISNGWRAQISIEGRKVFLGLFHHEEDAAIAYASVVVKRFGARAVHGLSPT